MAQYEASGLSQKTFCTQHAIGGSTFYYWRKQLRESSSVKNSDAGLVELPMLAMGDSGPWRVEIELGDGMVLRIK